MENVMKLKDLKLAIQGMEDSFEGALDKEIYIDLTFGTPEIIVELSETCVTMLAMIPEVQDEE